MKIVVKEAFAWWEDGIRKVEFRPGECDVSDDCARYAIESGLASSPDSNIRGEAPTTDADTGDKTPKKNQKK